MESLLKEIDQHWAKMMLEVCTSNPEILDTLYRELGDNTRADLEMAKLVEDPVDPRIVKIACKNGLEITLSKILKLGYSLKDENIQDMIDFAVENKSKDMVEVLRNIDVPEEMLPNEEPFI